MDDQESQIIEITEQDLKEYKRLDAYLAAKIPELSRNLIKKLFDQGHFKCAAKIELKKMPKSPVEIIFHPPEPTPTDIEPQNIPLHILFEDDHLIIVNKPAGLVVHPAPGNPDGTLVNAILYHCQNLKGIGNEQRPGIVHRLDKGTSGIMVVAKDQLTHEGLVNLFSKHDIKRQYEAISLGSRIPETDTLESTIALPYNRLKMASNVRNGKNAITHMKALEIFKHFSHVELTLETGRTHQIRVHLSELLNAPIMNDHTYGRIKEEQHLMNAQLKKLIKDYEYPFLHAKILGFVHPMTKEELYFEQEPPEIFKAALEILRGGLLSQLIFEKEFHLGKLEIYDDKPDMELIHVNQTHSDIVLEYRGHDLSQLEADGIFIDPEKYAGKNIAIKTADCLPILLLGRRLAFVHAGWKGLQNQILSNAVLTHQKFNQAFIAPSIQKYEVQEDFKEHFPNSDFFREDEGKLYFNLKNEAQRQLEKTYPDIKVFNSNICTFNQAEYNSYRRNKTKKRNWNIFKIN